MIKRRALGKGLASLLPDVPTVQTAPAPQAGEGLRYLDPGSLVPNRMQPRESFDEEDMKRLEESIRRDGILQPILVRPSEGGYEIVAGERRWRAAVHAGLKRVPAMVQSVADDRALELALIENLQRRDLDPIEEARAFKTLADRFGMTQEQIADRAGKSRPAIANALRILKLPAEVQELLRSGALTRGHARALLALEDEKEILDLARRLQEETMSVRSTEKAVRADRRAAGGAVKAADPNVRAAEERLQSRLGTRVRIQQGRRGKGRIEIEFDGSEELSRLFDGLMTARF
jgi:ParB family transcriptional regulator, chromosome partitioning protein